MGVRTVRRAREQGVAILELLIVCPLLITLLISTFEVGRALYQYMLLQEAAYEGARAASQLTIGSTSAGCLEDYVYMNIHGETDSRFEPHLRIQERVRLLLALQESRLSVMCDQVRFGPQCESAGALAEEPTISSELVLDGDGASSCGVDTGGARTFAVRVSGIYTPAVFPLSFLMTSEVRAPLLASTNDGFRGEVVERELQNEFPEMRAVPFEGEPFNWERRRRF